MSLPKTDPRGFAKIKLCMNPQSQDCKHAIPSNLGNDLCGAGFDPTFSDRADPKHLANNCEHRSVVSPLTLEVMLPAWHEAFMPKVDNAVDFPENKNTSV